MTTWANTTAEWSGEDWVFDNVPLEACPDWRGHTCFSPKELGCGRSASPEQAIKALQSWLEE